VGLFYYFKKRRAAAVQRKLNRISYNRFKHNLSFAPKKTAARILLLAVGEILLFFIFYKI